MAKLLIGLSARKYHLDMMKNDTQNLSIQNGAKFLGNKIQQESIGQLDDFVFLFYFTYSSYTDGEFAGL